MDIDQAQALTAPLTAAERDQVERAAAAAGKTVDGYVRDGIPAAAYDPFAAALERAADTIAGRADEIQHGYAVEVTGCWPAGNERTARPAPASPRYASAPTRRPPRW